MRDISILRRSTALGLGLAAAVCGAGCYSPFNFSFDEERLLSKGDYAIVAGLDVPKARGPDGCGAQALAAVLVFNDPALNARELADELPWHTEGATPVDLLLAARDRGFQAEITRGSWDPGDPDAAASHSDAENDALVGGQRRGRRRIGSAPGGSRPAPSRGGARRVPETLVEVGRVYDPRLDVACGGKTRTAALNPRDQGIRSSHGNR
jgi:hypothetical protein